MPQSAGSPASPPSALLAFVSGHVQGVYFRDFTLRHAVRLGLTGYVRNVRDGSVEIHAEGERDALEELLEVLRRGPPRARVDGIKHEWAQPSGKYHAFQVTG